MGAIRRDWEFPAVREDERDNVTAILYRIYNMAIDHLSGTLVSSLEREREREKVRPPTWAKKKSCRASVASIMADDERTSNSISSLYYLFLALYGMCGRGGGQVREKQIKMGSKATANNDFFFRSSIEEENTFKRSIEYNIINFFFIFQSENIILN